MAASHPLAVQAGLDILKKGGTAADAAIAVNAALGFLEPVANGIGGDVFVLVFFGLVAVPGTFYAQAQQLVPAVWPAAVAVGALGTTILIVNNLRDADTDARAGKRTLVVRLGRSFGRVEYIVLLLAALAMPVLMVLLGWARWPVLLALLAAPLALGPLRSVLTETGPALNRTLATTARLQAVYGLLFAAGAWLGRQ